MRDAAGRPYLLVTRYDRAEVDEITVRLHQEDACQALGVPSERKYAAEGGPAFRDLFALTRDYSTLPGVDVLRTCQDRLAEKEFLARAAVPVAPWQAVRSPGELRAAVATIGLPAVLKTTRLGYDGRGQAVLRNADEAEAAFDHLLSGEVTPAQTGAFLMGLRVRGETVDEITGAVAAMRSRMARVSAPAGAIDIVAGRDPRPDVAPAAMTRDAAGGSTAAAADPRAQA